MTSCREFADCIHPYIDGELAPAQQFHFEAHLVECSACRTEYDRVRQVVDIIRGSTPLYPAPSALPEKVKEILDGARSQSIRRKRLRVMGMAGAFAATILVFALLPMMLAQRFTSFAADTHLRYAHGSLPLGVTSDDPAEVSAWLAKHLPFHLALPNFAAEVGVPKSYSLVGAGLTEFDGQDVAYLAYTMDAHPISLLVSSSASVIPSGGEAYTSGKLLFHFSSDKGLKLITWEDRGLSYAIVSDVQVNGAQSCVVCHGSGQERRKFENLQRFKPGAR